MRITSGQYRGRTLNSPIDRRIRPTSDKIRQALFNQIRARIDCTDAQVLDAFAGTGALGFEALSNGAAHVTFMDSARAALDLVKQNAQALRVGDMCRILDADARTPPPNTGVAARLIFLDPPYGQGLIDAALEALGKAGWIAPDALIVCESERAWATAAPLSEKIYGDTKITLIRPAQSAISL